MTASLIALSAGTPGNDLLTGTDWSDALFGGAGNDTLVGGGADDTLDGGSGTNQIDAGDGNDLIVVDGTAVNGYRSVPATGVDGGAGFDTMVFAGASSNYHIVTIAGTNGGTLQITDLTTGARTTAINVEQVQFDDTALLLAPVPPGMILGTAGIDALTGTAMNDTMYGYGGDDAVTGKGGADHLDGGFGSDVLSGGAGNDTVLYDAADAQSLGGTGRDTLLINSAATVNLAAADQTSADAGLTSGFENAHAGAAQDSVTLTGSAAANSLTGGSAADLLTGGRGADLLAGGAGADVFVYLSSAESTGTTVDAISDFQSGVDQIDLSAIDAIRGGANDAFTFIGDAAFSTAGQLRYSAVSGLVEGDVNGDGLADFQIALTSTPTLTASDFIL